MIPVLSHFERHNDINYWVTMEGVVGTAFEITFVDLETQNVETIFYQIRQTLKSLDPRILVRFNLSVRKMEALPEIFPRSIPINSIGYRRYSIYLMLDYVGGFDLLKEFIRKSKKKSFSHELNLLERTAKSFSDSGITLKSLSEDVLTRFFVERFEHWRSGLRAIETGTESIGLIRIEKMPFESFDLKDLVRILEEVPAPITVNFSIQRLDEVNGRIFLEKKLKQTISGKDAASGLQAEEALSSLKDTLKAGGQLFTCEYLVELRRRSEEHLSRDLDTVASKLQNFAEPFIETFGVAPSFCATLPGNQQHVTFLELDEGVTGLLPVWGRREADLGRTQSIVSPMRSLSLFRADESLYHFDIFNRTYSAFNTLIVGSTGRGKSVLMGLLTGSLLNDPDVCIIKLDVGGSHSKECELFGGREYQLSLNKGSGVNPFDVIGIEAASDSDKVGLLSRFLASLILEEGELGLSKALRGEIEEILLAYIHSNPVNPSLDDFYRSSKSFPRRDLLKRWAVGGLYGAIFAGGEKLGVDNQLSYFNLKEIFNAADADFSRAAISAILCFFNMEVLKAHGKRIVLICDEVPFFIKKNFDFFKFTTANVRKLGATILSAQLSSDFVVDGDTGIIENSPQRFLFSIDGEEDAYRDRFGLDVEKIETLKGLRSIPGKFSEVLAQSSDGTRMLKIQVTPEEYWRLTTSRVDKDKLTSLMAAVPGLSLREAINCLSLER
ncbi:VirB4 family type IV secretion system protein [Bdellovibrio bacteriovorus]|uniref:VirB4 family type IV secretion system protein n=1 Tax=Bdellovibrio bacteriovorus TaxID=959 RepID=UPI003A80069A